MDERGPNSDCTLSGCLTYRSAPGERWAYHNAPYTLLHSIVENAAAQDFSTYFNDVLRDKIGMDGFWFQRDGDYNVIYYSTPRAMARFGLLILNGGMWDGEMIMSNHTIDTMLTPSQTHNPAYGRLWWLNGQSQYQSPTTGQLTLNGQINEFAPDDMVAALGKNGQMLFIVPSQSLVVVRMGNSSDNTPAALAFQNALWEKIQRVVM